MASAALLLASTLPADAATWKGLEPVDPRDSGLVAKDFAGRRAGALGLAPVDELEVLSRRTSPSGTYVRLERRIGRIRVEGGDVVVHSDRARRVDHARTRDLPPPPVELEPTIDADQAEAIGRAASGVVAAARAERRELVLVPRGAELRLAWELFLFSDDPVARWRVLVDAATGDVLRTIDMIRRVSGTGQVFAPSPVVALQNPALTDQDDADAAIPAGAYDTVTLLDLAPASGGVFRLFGPFARAVDLEPPAGAPPTSATATFVFTRAADAFEWVTTYFHLDAVQRRFQALGFTDVNARRIDFDAHGLAGEDNAHYVPNGHGKGYIALGDGGVDDGEDGEVIVHEYGHATQDDQCPNCFWGSESGAMGEGFGDFLAVAHFLEASAGFQDTCVGDWDSTSYSFANPPCIRRVDGAKHYPEDVIDDVHDDGEIWSGLLWDVVLALSGGATPSLAARDTVLRIVLESHFLVPPNPSFHEGAQALLDADQALFAGANRAVLEAALAARGLLPPPRAIFGGGSRRTDCAGAFAYDNPGNPSGPGSNKQQCTDGDPRCDADTIAGQCTFRLAVCFGRAGHPTCAPQATEHFEMRGPRPDDRKPARAAIGEALTAAVAALPGSVRGGLHDAVVRWAPLLAAGSCTPEVDVVVAMKSIRGSYRKTSLALRTLSVMPGNFRDPDMLRLTCVP